ncbi:DUF4178 domain-containing protein [Shewanella putrefaciens]|uniref:DUF4178 domain-containing protein n=1 Tax=Shewanella putrefaciens TaxID=24 RepID=A0ABX8X9G5_SHEPU|nr:hypothetical protein [Shewanella putrefaciens]AVV85455.1 hypothetical protein SPWS13_3764 [Shewanella putrefaciens]MCT8943057.1 DUF4178 domain-containing protein [Shewanella putrefaciens]QSE48711.1 hypothetical protein JW975_15405 [Shewanella putrefaciens]QYX72117.1 DUF4178 domain-containing protein [Shewanella putrefaciens]GGN10542.1 hypothetical protein GCM10007984_05390 [Shewanella putrefaciens]
MGFFNSIFGTKTPPQRELNHPSQLNVGDMISIDDSFALPTQLRGQQLKVEAVNTYEFERNQQAEWVLKGHGSDTIYLSIEEDDETYLALSIKITRNQVEQIFDLEQFSTLFDEPGHAELTTQALSTDNAAQLEQWLGKQYHQVTFAAFGYFHREDYRGLKPPQDANGNTGEPFEYYLLLNDDESRAIEIEVYEGGDTDVVLTLYRPLTDIREYWPSK